MKALVIACVTAMLSVSALAASGDKEAARKAYREGSTHYDLGHFADALAAFERAYYAYEDPAILYNIAQCQRQLNHKPEAVQFYKSYLRKSENPPNRAEVEKIIAELNMAIENDRALQARRPDGVQPPAGTHTDAPPKPEPQPLPAAAITAAPAPKHNKGAIIGGVVGGVLAVGLAVGLGVGLGTQKSNDPPQNTLGVYGVTFR